MLGPTCHSTRVSWDRGKRGVSVRPRRPGVDLPEHTSTGKEPVFPGPIVPSEVLNERSGSWVPRPLPTGADTQRGRGVLLPQVRPRGRPVYLGTSEGDP